MAVKLDLVAVIREAAARWRQDRALILPVAGLMLFLPQWAVLLLVPAAPRLVADPANAAAMAAWQRWTETWGPLYLLAFVIAQWGQLTLIALYVGDARDRPTLGQAMLRALRTLPRYVLAELLVSMPLAAAALAGSAMAPVLLVLVPVVIYVLARTLLIGPALLTRRLGAARSVVVSWEWTRGNGAPLAVLAGSLVLGAPILTGLVESLDDAMRAAHLGNPVVTAALDALAAGIAAAAMLALAMCVGVLFRRLAR